MLLVKTYVAKSDLHGNGLFADQFIPKGTVIWEYVEGFDVSVPEKRLAEVNPLVRHYFLKYAYKEDDNFILCSDDAKYMNHNDLANTTSPPDSTQTIAIRDIERFEEITCDYNEFDSDMERKLQIDQHDKAA